MKVDVRKLQQIAEGGEGIIYSNDPGPDLIKVFKPGAVNMAEKRAKVELLIAAGLPANIITPLEIVEDMRGLFIGYSMRKAVGDELRMLCNKKFVTSHSVAKNSIASLLTEIATSIDLLHSRGIVIGDLNDSNILFDRFFHPYFIDVDSWSLPGHPCTVVMDTFKDPLLKGNVFSAETDIYAFAILAFKLLTRLHPFGGTVTPDMSILDRMQRRQSVLGKTRVVIPKTIDGWSFVSPILLSALTRVYEEGKRDRFTAELQDFSTNMTQCKKHKDYYYAPFSSCPVCTSGANVVTAPTVVTAAGVMKQILLFSQDTLDPAIKAFDVRLVLSLTLFISTGDFVVNTVTKKADTFYPFIRYYTSDDGLVTFKVYDDHIEIQSDNQTYTLAKNPRSHVVVRDKSVYYVYNASLMGVTYSEKGNSGRALTSVSRNCIFDVWDDQNFFVCNIYDNCKIFHISKFMLKLDNADRIVNYGINYDEYTNQWLFVFENSKGEFQTRIFEGNKITKEVRTPYTVPLNNMWFSGGALFRAGDQKIYKEDYKHNTQGEFPCPCVSENSKLIRRGTKFLVLNEREVWEVG